jgi:hypothetical protein
MNAPTEQTDDAGPIRCADCRHRVTTEHPVLTDCAKGIRAPGAGGLWWSLDRHVCGEFERAGAEKDSESIVGYPETPEQRGLCHGRRQTVDGW